MTRLEAMAIAEDICPMCRESGRPAGYECGDCRNIAQAIMLGRTQTRIEAAERAVVEASLVMVDTWALWAKGEAVDNTLAGAQMKDTAARLRDLRANQEREECGATQTRYSMPGSERFGDRLTDGQHEARCTQPRGHEGEHRGELGEWRWT